MPNTLNFAKFKISLLLFFAFLVIFLLGNSQQVVDSRFTILLSHSFYKTYSNNLKPFLDFKKLEIITEELKRKYDAQGRIIESGQIAVENPGNANEKWRMSYSQVPSLLIIPFVYVLDHIGFAVTNPENGGKASWNINHEIWQQIIIASLMMAIYGVILFRIATLWLPDKFAAFITIVLVLGSGVASTLSRALWTDSFSCFFVLLALHHLVYADKKQKSANTYYVIILASLAVFCKPLYLFSAMALFLWLLIINKKNLLWIIIPSIVFAAFYLVWSWYSSQSFVANYDFGNFQFFTIQYFLGLIISPSRGIFVFSPWLIFILILLLMFGFRLTTLDRKMLLISLFPVIAIFALLSCYELWWAGLGYGARLQSPALPWLSLISIILVGEFYRQIISIKVEKIKDNNLIKEIQYKPKLSEKVLIGLAMVSSILAIMINLYGVTQAKTFIDWHTNIVYDPRLHKNTDEAIIERMWNWRDPIFLAGIVKPERYIKRK